MGNASGGERGSVSASGWLCSGPAVERRTLERNNLQRIYGFYLRLDTPPSPNERLEDIEPTRRDGMLNECSGQSYVEHQGDCQKVSYGYACSLQGPALDSRGLLTFWRVQRCYKKVKITLQEVQSHTKLGPKRQAQ